MLQLSIDQDNLFIHLCDIFIDIPARMGLTNYLSGKTDKIEDIIITNDKYKNLDIIFAGPVPPNPAELLLSERFDRMVTELKKHYDYVILDNVPVDIVADASIINRVVDLTIYVVRWPYYVIYPVRTFVPDSEAGDDPSLRHVLHRWLGLLLD